MISKQRLRKIELPVLLGFLALWLLTYILSRIFLEMYTDDAPSSIWVWLLVIIVPLSLYAALRTAFSEGGKWYGAIGYLLIYTIGALFAGEYMVLNGDILLSACIKTPVKTEAKVISVEKIIKRKLGFDHTAVTLKFGENPVTLEARPYSFFYLQDKKTIQITAGTSFLGNTYATSSGVSVQEKLIARWLHLKDWAYRFRLLWGILLCMILAVIIREIYFPEKVGTKPLKIGFLKFLGILMGILMAIGLLLYAGLWIYVKYFISR